MTFLKDFIESFTTLPKPCFQIYMVFVRKIEDGVLTSCNNTAQILWQRKYYKGSELFVGNDIRYFFSQDYLLFLKNVITKTY